MYLETVEVWKANGYKIGFTNGCFDILHPGHIHLLTYAREYCDKLVVGLNSDASVKMLKGDTRPVNTELKRWHELMRLKSVDLVVGFNDLTPLTLIKELRPHVLIKGADYAKNNISGASFVEKHGGKVIIVPLLKGYSTTRILSEGVIHAT